MKKLPGVIVIEHNGEQKCVRVMATLPTTTINNGWRSLNGGLGEYLPVYEINDIELDVLQNIQNQHTVLTEWGELSLESSRDRRDFPTKKNATLYFDKGIRLDLTGCWITSYAIEYIDDEDMTRYTAYQDLNIQTREVLFEKIGYEKIRVLIVMSLSIDRIQFIQ